MQFSNIEQYLIIRGARIENEVMNNRTGGLVIIATYTTSASRINVPLTHFLPYFFQR